MSLRQSTPLETAEFELIHPKTNLPMGIFIELYGAHTEHCKSIQRKQNNKRMERSAKSRNGRLNLTAEELEKDALEVLAGCTKSWRTGTRPEIELDDNEWLPCTPENVKKAYEVDWIKGQVDQNLNDVAIFLPE